MLEQRESIERRCFREEPLCADCTISATAPGEKSGSGV